MNIGEKIIAAINEKELACGLEGETPFWNDNAAKQLEAVVEDHIEERVKHRLDQMICVVRKNGSYVLLPIKTKPSGEKYVDMDDEIVLKMM